MHPVGRVTQRQDPTGHRVYQRELSIQRCLFTPLPHRRCNTIEASIATLVHLWCVQNCNRLTFDTCSVINLSHNTRAGSADI